MSSALLALFVGFSRWLLDVISLGDLGSMFLALADLLPMNWESLFA